MPGEVNHGRVLPENSQRCALLGNHRLPYFRQNSYYAGAKAGSPRYVMDLRLLLSQWIAKERSQTMNYDALGDLQGWSRVLDQVPKTRYDSGTIRESARSEAAAGIHDLLNQAPPPVLHNFGREWQQSLNSAAKAATVT